jgi:hypothetical protein
MPIGDIAGEALGGVFRFVGRLLFEVVVEVLIQGTGHVILRTVRPKSEPGETACTLVGLLFWATVIVLGWFLYRQSIAA